MCDACMKFDSECSNSDFQEKECSSATYDNQLHIREGSPDITVQKVTESSLFSSKFFVLPKRDPKIVSTRKYQEDDISNLEEDFEFQSTFLSASNQHDSFLQQVQKDTPRGIAGTYCYDEPPASFKTMDERRFQYVIFMELATIKSEIKICLSAVEKLGGRTEPEDSLCFMDKCENIIEFDEREIILNNNEKFRLMVRQLKQIGGNSISASVNKVLDKTMTKSVQALFNKAGRYGKRSFQKTLLYKAIIETLVSHSTKLDLVDKLIGDHLKRAPDRLT
nr:uncharacterized protein LOC124815573 [Hydra vulgaris]XP_047140309.1 uncharacterized protein LOC124815573 [Hydra vulgaris]